MNKALIGKLVYWDNVRLGVQALSLDPGNLIFCQVPFARCAIVREVTGSGSVLVCQDRNLDHGTPEHQHGTMLYLRNDQWRLTK